MELNTSTTQRGLNVKMKVGGMDAFDLICCLILCAVLNMLFGSLSFGPIIVFGVPGAALLCLYFGKRGKPDDYLRHLIRFYLTPGFYSAAETGSSEMKMREKIYEQ